MIQRMTVVATFGLFAASFALGAQLADEPGQSPDWWSYHILSADGLPHVLFLLSLLMAPAPQTSSGAGFGDRGMFRARMNDWQGAPQVLSSLLFRVFFIRAFGFHPDGPRPPQPAWPAYCRILGSLLRRTCSMPA